MKKIVLLQIILLASAVTLGLILKMNLIEGPRLLHRLMGTSAGVVGVVTAVWAYQQKHSVMANKLAILTLILTLIAGTAGSMLYKVADYNMAYLTMMTCGVCALLTSLLMYRKIA